MHKCSIASMLNGEFASDVAAKNRIFLVTAIHRVATPAPSAPSQPPVCLFAGLRGFQHRLCRKVSEGMRLAPWLHQAHEAGRILKRLEYRTGACPYRKPKTPGAPWAASVTSSIATDGKGASVIAPGTRVG
jgi:hypothetical protein